MGVNTAADYGDGACVNAPGRGNSTVVECSSSNPWMYGTFRLNFHHFDRFELDLRGHIHVRGAALSCLRLKLADIVLI